MARRSRGADETRWGFLFDIDIATAPTKQKLDRIAKLAGQSYQHEYTEALTAANKAGWSPTSAKKYADVLMKNAEKIADRQQEMLELDKKMQEALARGEDVRELKRHREKLRRDKLRADLNFRKEIGLTGRLADEMGRKQFKFWHEHADDIGDWVSGGITGALSKDLPSMLTGAGGQFKALGKITQMKGLEKGGALGGLLKVLGPLAMGIGLFAGALAAVVKILIDADAEVKGFNKDLFSSGVAVSEVAASVGQFEGNLDNFSKRLYESTFTGALSNWKLLAKDIAQIVGSYAQAGVVLKEITAGAASWEEQMQKVEKSMETTLTYAKLFGVEAGEMAGQMGNWMEGLGENFESIRTSLASIHVAARESGFGVKRFYSLIAQATADMTMYNVRLEEAGMLLTKMGKAMGVKAAGEQLQTLTKGFVAAGMGERVNIILKAGKEKTEEIYQMGAGPTVEDFLRKLSGATDDTQRVVREALSGAIEGKDLTTENLVAGLGKLNERQLTELFTKVRLAGDDNLTAALEPVVGQAQGATGSLDKMARYLHTMSQGQVMLMKFAAAGAVLDKDINEMTMVEREGFQKVSGLLGEEELRVLKFQQAVRGGWRELNTILKSGRAMTEEEKLRFADQVGAIVENGKIIEAKLDENATKGYVTGSEIKKVEELLIKKMSDAQTKALEETVPADVALAQMTAKNTTEMTQILERGVAYILRQIYGVTQAILAKLTFWGDDAAQKEAQKVLDALGEDIERSEKTLSLLHKRLATKQAELPLAAKDKGKTRKLELEIEGIRQEEALEQKKLRDLKKIQHLAAVDKTTKGKKESGGAAGRIRGYREEAGITDDPMPARVSEFGRALYREFSPTMPQGDVTVYNERSRELTRLKKLGELFLQSQLAGDAIDWEKYEVEERDRPRVQSALDRAIAATTPAEDFIMQIGAGGVKYAQRVDPGDVVVASKPGGALGRAGGGAGVGAGAGAGGGGGVTNVFHLYNDAPGMVKAIAEAQRAGVLD